jgi:hypothetical protein
MAGDWIKMRTNLRTHPKVVRISSALQCDALRVIGALWAVWSIADEHAAVQNGAGHLDGYSLSDMSSVISFPGFAEQMAVCGWIDECDEHAQNGGKCLIFKDFDTHNGKSAKSRAEDSERKRASRQSGERPKSVRKVSVERPKSVRKVSVERPAETVTREEKRREEINTHRGGATAEVVGVSGQDRKDHEHEPQAEPPVTPSAAGKACLVLKKSGLQDVNPGHPELLELLAGGCTEAELAGAAVVAVGKGKGFAYALGVLRGQRGEAAQRAAAGVAVPIVSGQVATNWRATRSGIDAKGVELGLGKWDQSAFEHGQGEPFARFEARVVAAAGGVGEVAVVDPAGSAKVMQMIGKAFAGVG